MGAYSSLKKNYKSVAKFLSGKRDYKKSYSQCGEDMILYFILENLNINQLNYLDIGTNDPKNLNNTYFFYKYKKANGVLVEPNPALAARLKAERPRDILYNCGIGYNNKEEFADYYLMDWHEFNTFSKEIAHETQEFYKGKNNIVKVEKIKLIGINQILEKHFSKGLDLLSIDVEGLDLAILKSMDFNKYKPKVICVETKVVDIKNSPEISVFLIGKGYKLHSQTPINGIFVYGGLDN
jgi:FkbM family methyltransferase